jgi:hypothetical protein
MCCTHAYGCATFLEQKEFFCILVLVKWDRLTGRKGFGKNEEIDRPAELPIHFDGEAHPFQRSRSVNALLAVILLQDNRSC